MTYILIAIIAAAGSFVQSATGFGYALICMGFLPLIIPFYSASILEISTAFFMVFYLTLKMRNHINFKMLIYPLISSLICSSVGVLVQYSLTDIYLRRIMGIMLILLSVFQLCLSKYFVIKPTRLNGLVFGAISGLSGGLLSIGGPPMVIYLIASTESKEEYNATIQCYFFITAIYTFLMHMLAGNLSGVFVGYTLVSLFGLAIGITLGTIVFKRVHMDQLKKVVYIFMAAVGIYLIIAGETLNK